jgi:hypothetical protein
MSKKNWITLCAVGLFLILVGVGYTAFSNGANYKATTTGPSGQGDLRFRDSSGNILLKLGSVVQVGSAGVPATVTAGAATNASLVVSGTTDLNGATTATNITMDTGSTLAAKTLTVATSADINAAMTATNITLDSGARMDCGENNVTNCGIVSADTLQPDGTALAIDTGTGEATVDGKYATVGPDATTPVMHDYGNATIGAGGTITQAFTTAFGAAPRTLLTYAENPGDSTNVNVSLYSTTETTTNFIITGVASKEVHWYAVGQRP